MIVKICGVTTRKDALVSVEAGATAIGFNFYLSSPRYVAAEAAAEIASCLPAGVLKVGVFVNEPPASLARIAALAGLDVIQLHGGTAPGHRSWRACRMDADFTAASLDDANAEAFLLDTASAELHGGTGRTFDWRIARGLARRIILAGGLDASNVRRAIETAEPWGVDACSRLESAPGRKDPRKVLEFVKAALSL